MEFSAEPTGVMHIYYCNSDIVSVLLANLSKISLITITPVSHYAHFN